MKRTLILIAAISAIVVFSGLVHAQVTGNGGIHGKVLDQDGKPLQGAIARVEELANHYRAEGKTGKNGEYSIVGLYQGRYKVTLILNNRLVMTIGDKDTEAIFVSANRDEPANFDLRKVAPEVLAAAPVAAPGPDASKGKSKAEI